MHEFCLRLSASVSPPDASESEQTTSEGWGGVALLCVLIYRGRTPGPKYWGILRTKGTNAKRLLLAGKW